ncbi:M23 family metallopeptidase [Microlunatus parietis]|uniref:Murein DD-endopeptidase MepM/ murein hydrolase activator NlpD n=1 Tax=Microlunatus parietis TaxID=682979 RepID=A0A7Y9ICC4_9ACTN|nr:M23 family metallopeptidase [Microlunatus parietis]NYE73684.1 murein DD-endopeptidase MepM/ murein hydrolase activator NlpD [Microlunatus parietis]
MTHGIAALTVSALGLAVAGSVALSTSAAEGGQVAITRPNVQAAQPQNQGDRREAAAEDPSRSQDRELQAKELAAYREEALARDAEAALKAAHEENLKQRSEDLSEAEKESYENAARIAKERREAAARRAAEQGNQDDSSDDSSNDDSDDGSYDDSSDDTEPPPSSGGGAASPVPGAVIGAYFGQTGLWARYHTGLDFRAGSGTPIKSVQSGTVLHAGYGGNAGSWAGNYVAIKHPDGNTTLYAHMSSNSVSPGQRVSAGQVIGHVGSTGRSFGAHLHFELYRPGARYGDVYSASNPQPWLNALGVNTN